MKLLSPAPALAALAASVVLLATAPVRGEDGASVVESVGLTATATFAEVIVRSEGSLVGAQVGGDDQRVELRLPDVEMAADLQAPPAQALVQDVRLTRTEPGLLIEVETARPVDFEVAGGDGSIRLRLRQKDAADAATSSVPVESVATDVAPPSAELSCHS